VELHRKVTLQKLNSVKRDRSGDVIKTGCPRQRQDQDRKHINVNGIEAKRNYFTFIHECATRHKKAIVNGLETESCNWRLSEPHMITFT